MRRAAAIVLALATAAHAEPAETYRMVSVPLTIGGATGDASGFTFGFRPEVVLAKLRDTDRGHGLGLYGELTYVAGGALAGAGVTYVGYQDQLAIAPSAGLHASRADEDSPLVGGYTLGVFLGRRAPSDWLPMLDLPYGVRFDYRATGDEQTVTICVVADLAVLALVVAGVSQVLPRR